MKNFLLFGIFLIFLAGPVFAQNCNVEFQQVSDRVVIKDSFSGENFQFVEFVNLENSGNNYFFTYKYNFLSNCSSERVVFVLDEDFVEKAIFPINYNISGREIIWENVSPENQFAIFLNLQKKNNYYWFFVLVFFVLVIIYFQIKKKLKKTLPKKRKKQIINFRYLLDEEKKIILMLERARRREMWQNAIQHQGEFSKAKTSRLIKNLETRGLIKKISFGNTNKIVLK
jgi:uncharacterized membrane protein